METILSNFISLCLGIAVGCLLCSFVNTMRDIENEINEEGLK